MPRKPRTPSSSASSTTSGRVSAGTHSTASSGTSGRSRRPGAAATPSTTAPDLFTRYTLRRCAPRSAPLASQYPHLAGLAEAPTTATDEGSEKITPTWPASGR